LRENALLPLGNNNRSFYLVSENRFIGPDSCQAGIEQEIIYLDCGGKDLGCVLGNSPCSEDSLAMQ